MDIIKKIKQLFSNPKCITCGKPIGDLFEDGNEHIHCTIERFAADCNNENDRMYEEALKRLNEIHKPDSTLNPEYVKEIANTKQATLL